MMGIPGALVIPFAPPGIQGLSVFGGFQYELLDQTGGDISGLAEQVGALSAKANQSGQVVGLFSGFRANDPQLVVDIDRDKARSLDVPLREVTDALQVFLGSAYVNDFDFNNRAYRVYVQADQQYRSDPRDLKQLYARSSRNAMVPLDSLVRTRETTAPQVISHFNLFRSAEINGAPGARGQLRARPCATWSSSRGRRCRPASTSRGRASRWRRSRPAPRPSSSSPSASPSSTSCWPPNTRAGCCRSSSCSACPWPSSGAWARSGCAASPTTSSARSGS